MEDQAKIRLLLDIQEHPENYTDEQIKQMLSDDPQLDEILEEAAMAKRALVRQETSKENVPVDDLWHQFAEDHAEELEHLNNGKSVSGRFPFMKIAAIFIGLVLLAGVVYGTVVSFGIVHNPFAQAEERTVGETQKDTIRTAVPEASKDTLAKVPRSEQKIITFENKPLPEILSAMADYYHVDITYEDEAVKNIRLYFEWNQTKSLDNNLQLLNSFQQIDISRDGDHLKVK